MLSYVVAGGGDMTEENKKFWEEFHLFHDYVLILREYERGRYEVEDLEQQRIQAHKAIADYYGVEKEDLCGVLHNIDLKEEGADKHTMATVKELIAKGLVRKISPQST